MMINLLYDIWCGLRSHPGRTLLSFFGIAIGTASLTILLNVTGSLQRKAETMQTAFGTETFSISFDGDANEHPPIEQRHIDLLKANLTNHAISAVTTYELTEPGRLGSFTLISVDANLLKTRPWSISSGRFPDQEDINRKQRVCTVSGPLAMRSKIKTGDIITVRNIPLQVIGIIDAGNQISDSEVFSSLSGVPALFVPHTLPPFWIDWQHARPANYFNTIYVKSPPHRSMQRDTEIAQQLFACPEYILKNCKWITPEVVTAQIRQWQKLIEWAAGGIAILCLTMGGVTLMSLMISNINARIPEIGLRISLGAGRRQIILLFLSEAAVIISAACCCGILGSNMMLLASRNSIPLELQAWRFSSITALLITLVLGGLFSIWPAFAVCRISPSEALRNE